MPRKNHEGGIVVYDDRVTTAMKMNSKQWLLAIGAGIVVGAGVYLMLPLIVVCRRQRGRELARGDWGLPLSRQSDQSEGRAG